MITCTINGHEGVGETAFAALVACLLDIDTKEALEESSAEAIVAQARKWAEDHCLSWVAIGMEFQRAAVELGIDPDQSSFYEFVGCPHDELSFDRTEDVEDGLVVHVNCRACGRSGSYTIITEDVLW